MQLSTAGVNLIKQFEGYRDEAYADVIGVWTIGYGTTRVDDEPVQPGMTCTEDQACEWLAQESDAMLSRIEEHIQVDLSQNQVDAIGSLMYNIGVNAFRKSTLLRCINSEDTAGIEREWLRWCKAGGKTIPGLRRRREMELDVFMQG